MDAGMGLVMIIVGSLGGCILALRLMYEAGRCDRTDKDEFTVCIRWFLIVCLILFLTSGLSVISILLMYDKKVGELLKHIFP